MEFGQCRYMNFFPVHDLLLDSYGKCCGFFDVSGFTGPVFITKHHDQRLLPLQEVHPPTGADLLHVNEVTVLGLVQPSYQTEASGVILQASKPTLESRSEFDRVHTDTVIVRRQIAWGFSRFLCWVWYYREPRKRLGTLAISHSEIPPSPLRDKVSYSNQARFRGYYPFTLVSACTLPV